MVRSDVERSRDELIRAEVRAWMGRAPTWRDRLLGSSSARGRRVLDAVLGSGPMRRAVEVATSRLVDVLDRRVLDGVPRRLEARYASIGVPVHDPADVRALDLTVVERAAEGLRDPYVRGALAQGALTGAASVTPGLSVLALAVDLPSAIGGSLVAAADHLATYGFDPRDPDVRDAAIHAVAIGTESDPVERRRLIAEAATMLQRSVHRGQVPTYRRHPVAEVAVQQVATRAATEALEQLVRRVLRRRAAAVVPVLGAVAGGALNAHVAGRVCDAARSLGRAAWLARASGEPVHRVLGMPT